MKFREFRRLRRRDYDSEIKFWRDYVASPTGIFDTKARRAAFPQFLLPFLEKLDCRRPRLLELGSGPVSLLAWGVDEGIIDVVAVDPLARTYNEMMRPYDYPVRPREGYGEELLKYFRRDEFDAAYTSNALDHTASPADCMNNLIAVVRPGGIICIEGLEREGSSGDWEGLHEHDLVATDEDLLCIDRHGRKTNLTSDLDCVYKAVSPFTERGLATHGYEYDPAADYAWFRRNWYSMIFKIV